MQSSRSLSETAHSLFAHRRRIKETSMVLILSQAGLLGIAYFLGWYATVSLTRAMLVISYDAHKSTPRRQNSSFTIRRTKELCIDHWEFLVDGRNYTFTTHYMSLPIQRVSPFFVTSYLDYNKVPSLLMYIDRPFRGTNMEQVGEDSGSSWQLFGGTLRLPASDTKMICVSSKNWTRMRSTGRTFA